VIEDGRKISTALLSAASDAGHRNVIRHIKSCLGHYKWGYTSTLLVLFCLTVSILGAQGLSPVTPHSSVHSTISVLWLSLIILWLSSILWTTVLTTASSSDSSSNVTRSWQNYNRETTSTTSDWTNTTAAAVDNSTSCPPLNQVYRRSGSSKRVSAGLGSARQYLSSLPLSAILFRSSRSRTRRYVTNSTSSLWSSALNANEQRMARLVTSVSFGAMLRRDIFRCFEPETNTTVAPEPDVSQVVDQFHFERPGILWPRRGQYDTSEFVAPC